jgi:hypothetical protein
MLRSEYLKVDTEIDKQMFEQQFNNNNENRDE